MQGGRAFAWCVLDPRGAVVAREGPGAVRWRAPRWRLRGGDCRPARAGPVLVPLQLFPNAIGARAGCRARAGPGGRCADDARWLVRALRSAGADRARRHRSSAQLGRPRRLARTRSKVFCGHDRRLGRLQTVSGVVLQPAADRSEPAGRRRSPAVRHPRDDRARLHRRKGAGLARSADRPLHDHGDVRRRPPGGNERRVRVSHRRGTGTASDSDRQHAARKRVAVHAVVEPVGDGHCRIPADHNRAARIARSRMGAHVGRLVDDGAHRNLRDRMAGQRAPRVGRLPDAGVGRGRIGVAGLPCTPSGERVRHQRSGALVGDRARLCSTASHS